MKQNFRAYIFSSEENFDEFHDTIKDQLKISVMKSVRYTLIVVSFSFLMASCSLFKRGEGCPSNGKNVGAEKVLEMSDKELKKSPKFKA